MSVSDETEKLLTEAEALSAMIHLGEKVSFGQDTAMIDRLVAALRAIPAPGVKPDVAEIESGGKRWHGEDRRVVSVRWEPYKPDGARQMKAKGRWQEQVGSGDYWRWQNCERPQFLAALDTPAPAMGELVEALRGLVQLNDDYSPFGGELLQDRVDRTWQRARAVLAKIGGAA
jgi:hypothetical protein